MARRARGMKPHIAEWKDYSDDLGIVAPTRLIELAEAAGEFVWDLETTGLSPLKDRIEGIAFYIPAAAGNPAIRAWYPFVPYTFMCHMRVKDLLQKYGEFSQLGIDVEPIQTQVQVWRDKLIKQHIDPATRMDDLILLDLRSAMEQEETIEALRPIWEDLRATVSLAHHSKFDTAFMYYASGTSRPVVINNILGDSMLADFASDERRMRYGLKYRTKEEFGHQMTTYNEAVRGQSLLPFCNAKPLGVYAMDDCYWTHRLHDRAITSLRCQAPPPRKRKELRFSVEKTLGRVMGKLERIYWGIDTKISRILMEMENSGVMIDWRWLREVEERLEKEKEEVIDRIEQYLGWPLNPNSGKQCIDALFAPPPDGLGLPMAGIPVGKKGDPSTADKVIKHFARFHPLVEDILRCRSIDTVLGGFVKKLIKLSMASPDGRVYARFNQTRTVIARPSCISSESILSIRLGDEEFRRSIKIAELKRFVGQTVRIVTHKGHERRILSLINKGPGLMYEVTTDDGNSIRCTQDHRFLTERGWCALKNIERGDRLIRAEISSPSAGGRTSGKAVGVGPTVVPENFRRRHTSNTMEDSRLWVVQRNRAHLQKGLRLGVPAVVPLNTRTVTGPGRGLADCPNVGQTFQVERVCDFTGIVQGDLRRQRSDSGPIEVDGVAAAKHDPRERGQEGAPHIRCESGGNAPFTSFDGCRNPASTSGLVLEELASGFRVAGSQADGRGRWRISPELRGDQGSRRAQNQEDKGTWFPSASYQQEGRASTPANCGKENCGSAWTRVTSIASVGVEDVWDIEVEEDESYIAHGLIHHNSSNPINFQNQPREKNLVRKAYVAYRKGVDKPNKILLGGDYSQIELRVAAHLAQEDNMIEVYQMGGICVAESGQACARYQLWVCEHAGCEHKWTPKLWTAPNGSLPCPNCGKKDKTEHQARCRHVDLHQRTADDANVRRNPLAKNLNFGTLYRMGAPKFCVYADLFDADGLPMVPYAREIIDRWHAAYPAINLFHDRTEWEVEKNGWIAHTLFGRRRRLDQEMRINRFRAITQAIQFKVSGSAQDIMKTGMIRVVEERERRKAKARPAERKLWEAFKMLLQVHDEIICEIPVELQAEATSMVKKEMESVGKGYLKTPLVFEVKCGHTWESVH